MQKARQDNFIDRATYYVARDLAVQGYKGKDEEDIMWDYNLKPVIGVFICNFHVPDLERKAIVKASTMDEETHKPIGMKSRYIFIQLPFFNKEEEECDRLDEQWIYNIKNMGIRQEVAFKNNSEAFKRLAQIANVATLTPEERYHYEADLKNVRDTINQIRTAYHDGEAKGAYRNLKENVESMRKNGLDNAMIARFLNKPLDLINSL